MQLSINARKVMASGLAASTFLWAAVGAVPQFASAAVHSEGCLVISNGTVWLITGGVRKGFPTAPVMESYGYNFSQVAQATAEDLALPQGPVVTYADNTLVKGPSDPLVYLVSGGQKRPFVSGNVFVGLGYQFSNIQLAPTNTFADLPTGPNLDSTVMAHPIGSLVITNGEIWQMGTNSHSGFPSMAAFNSFGYKLNNVVQANAADLATANSGAVTARPACTGGNVTPPVSTGPVQVSLASDNPASNTIVLGQATADLAHFVFSGSGAVTSLTLNRIGVSSNSLLANVYLFNGNLRITDSSSVNTNGQISFNNAAGLFTAPASISVRADIAPSPTGSSGQTVGVAFASGMSGTNNITGSASGNLFTTANPGNVATVVFTANTAAGGSGNTVNVNAGSLNYTIWSAPVSVGNRSVLLKGLMLKGVGSAPTDALQNYVLYVDGTQVATASGLQAINGSNYAVFMPTTAVTLTTGSHTLEARADIIKGSARTIQFTLQNSADITVTDTSFNVNVTPNTTNTATLFAANDAGTLNIQTGVVTVQQDPAFNGTTTVVGGATNIPLAKFLLTAYGEDVQINTLVVTFAGTGLAAGLNNVTLFANGGQVGSTYTTLTAAGTASFSLGSQLIVPAGTTPTHLTVQADTLTNPGNLAVASGTAITVSLVAASQSPSNNAQGRSSQNPLKVPSAGTVTGPTLTVGASSMNVAANSAYTNQTLTPNTQAQKIGSFVIQAGTSEGVRVTNLQVGLCTNQTPCTPLTGVTTPPLTDISNLSVSVNGGAASTPIAPQASNNFSQNFTVAVNSTAVVDVWADLGSSTGSFATSLLPSAIGVISNVSATSGTAAGQLINLATGTLVAPTFTTASSSASQFIAAAGGSTDGTSNSFNISATSGAINVSELKFVVNATSTAGTVSSVKVGSVSAPVITPAATTVSDGSLANVTDPVTFNVASSAGMSVGSIITDTVGGTEDMLVIDVPSSTSVRVARAKNGTAAAPHAAASAITIHGMAYLTGLNLAVPNGSGGIYVNAMPTYSNVGTTGIPSASLAELALTYAKYTSGSTTTAVPVSATLPFGVGALVRSNLMYMVGSNMAMTVASTNNAGLVLAENQLMSVSITPNAKGNIQLNTLTFTVSTSGITASTLATSRLAVGSTTITGAVCTTTGVSPTFTDTCVLPAGYVLTAGVPVTLNLFGTVGGTISGGANTASVATSLLNGTTFSWTDTAGGGSAITTTDNSTYFLNFPTQAWSVHN
ncbi:MAG: hypothetical protein ABI643_03295 [Candidatus Doudnabacteria bacterium]